MAEIGFGYSRQETINLASDYAVHLGLKETGHRFSLKWLYGFLGRWPDLTIKKPRALEIARAKSATKPVIDRYFSELNTILTKYHLKDKPGRIYNVDEKGLSLNHKPPKILTGKTYKAQAVTGGKSQTVTVIGGGNALGHQIPPYFVFPGVRMQPGFLDGATPGVSANMSESGWSNTDIFHDYMQRHLEPLLPPRDADNKVLILYDGHKSHVSLSLIEWAKQNHIILFVLPPHCSHLLQPMDVSCFGPFETAWNSACHHHLRTSGGSVVTKNDVCSIACKVYTFTLTVVNIQSAFKHCGIYPFNDNVISDSIIAPSLSFLPANEPKPAEKCDNVQTTSDAASFLECRGGQMLQNVKSAKVRKTLSKVVGGKPITEDAVYSQVKDHINNSKGKQINDKSKHVKTSKKGKISQTKQSKPKQSVQIASTSNPHKSATNVANDDDSDFEDDVPDSEKCCICKLYTPSELKYCVNLTLVKWAQCDLCDRWVHLRFCTPVTVVRRGAQFHCPNCKSIEE